MASRRNFLMGALAAIAIFLLAPTTSADYYRTRPQPLPWQPPPEESHEEFPPVTPSTPSAPSTPTTPDHSPTTPSAPSTPTAPDHSPTTPSTPTTPDDSPPTPTIPDNSPSTPTTPSLPFDAASLRGMFVGLQNAARARVGVGPLVWDTKLERYAMWWANQRRSDCSLTHSNGPYGENIFWGSGSDWTPAQAVESWVEEDHSYDAGSNSCRGGMCGHYTQIVWRDTKRVGCARVVCDDNRGVFITCNYDPPGNFIGERPF